VCAILAFGCGDDNGKRPSGPLTAAEYRSAANSICRDAERWGEGLEDELGTNPEPADAFKALLEGLRRYNDEYEQLNPPARLEAQHAAAVEDATAIEGLFEELGSALGRKGAEQSAFERFSQDIQPIFERSNKRARRMGLDDCVDESPLPGD
jgi:hypothetical protein